MAFMHSNNTNLITLNNFYDLIDNELLNGYIIEKLWFTFKLTKKSLCITWSSYWILIKYFNSCIFPNDLVYRTAAYSERKRLEIVASAMVTLLTK